VDTLTLIFNLFFVMLGAFLSVMFAKVLKQNGTVLEKMDEGFRKMD